MHTRHGTDWLRPTSNRTAHARHVPPRPEGARQQRVLPEGDPGAARAEHGAAAAQLDAAPARRRAAPRQHRAAGRLRVGHARDRLGLLLRQRLFGFNDDIQVTRDNRWRLSLRARAARGGARPSAQTLLQSVLHAWWMYVLPSCQTLRELQHSNSHFQKVHRDNTAGAGTTGARRTVVQPTARHGDTARTQGDAPATRRGGRTERRAWRAPQGERPRAAPAS